VAGDGFVAAEGVETLVGFALEVDAVQREGEEIGKAGAELGLEGGEAWALEDDGEVDVGDGVGRGANAGEGFGEEAVGGGVFPAGVGIGEEFANVGKGKGAEEGVGEGVEEDVAIAVGDKGEVAREDDAREEEGLGVGAGGRVGEAVEVETVADAEVGRRGGGHEEEGYSERRRNGDFVRRRGRMSRQEWVAKESAEGQHGYAH